MSIKFKIFFLFLFCLCQLCFPVNKTKLLIYTDENKLGLLESDEQKAGNIIYPSEDYIAGESILSPILSPDGKNVAMFKNQGLVVASFTADGTTSRYINCPINVTFGDLSSEPIIRSMKWIDNDHILVNRIIKKYGFYPYIYDLSKDSSYWLVPPSLVIKRRSFWDVPQKRVLHMVSDGMMGITDFKSGKPVNHDLYPCSTFIKSLSVFDLIIEDQLITPSGRMLFLRYDFGALSKYTAIGIYSANLNPDYTGSNLDLLMEFPENGLLSSHKSILLSPDESFLVYYLDKNYRTEIHLLDLNKKQDSVLYVSKDSLQSIYSYFSKSGNYLYIWDTSLFINKSKVVLCYDMKTKKLVRKLSDKRIKAILDIWSDE